MPDISGGNYSQENAEAQKILVKSLVDAIRDRQFTVTASLLEMLAKSMNDKRVALHIAEVKEKISIDFGTFELLYRQSFMKDPRRGVIIQHAEGRVERITFPKICRRFEREVISPLLEIAVEMVGRISVSKSVFMENFIEAQKTLGGGLDTVNEVKARKVKVIL